MTPQATSHTGPPSILDHDLNQYFPELLKFESTPEMEASGLYAKILSDVERLMNAVVVEDMSPVQSAGFSPYERDKSRTLNPVKALAWNLERGIRFDGILDGGCLRCRTRSAPLERSTATFSLHDRSGDDGSSSVGIFQIYELSFG